MRRRPLLLLGAAGAALVLLPAPPAAAHPLGNFTTNTFTLLYVQDDGVEIDYVVDLAEIPALQALQGIDGDGDDEVGDAEGLAYRSGTCAEVAASVSVSVGGTRLDLAVEGSTLEVSPGQAGLDVLRLECVLVSERRPLADDEVVVFEDGNFDGRVGWREVVAVGDGATLDDSSVPEEGVSDRLRTYPEDRLESPPVVRTAELVASPGGPRPEREERGEQGDDDERDAAERLEEAGSGAGGLYDRFLALIEVRRLTVPIGVLGGIVAVGFGAGHAVLPGHGKTVIAAYLLGGKHQRRLSVLLGLTVALTHTSGVLVLSLAVLTSETFAPEQVYPLLGGASGLLFAGLGVVLLVQALRRRRWHGHFHLGGHDHGHRVGHAHQHDGHEHDGHEHDPTGDDHTHGLDGQDHPHGDGHLDHGRQAPTWRSVLLPGVAGGLVPSPGAILVFTGGYRAGRTWYGVVLVVAYGIGLGATLILAGSALVRLRATLEQRAGARSSRVRRLDAVLPVITAVLVILGGAYLTARAFSAA